MIRIFASMALLLAAHPANRNPATENVIRRTSFCHFATAKAAAGA
jgi:hypothetical protein